MRIQLKAKKNTKKLCRQCSAKRALYRRGEVVRWKRGFDLCFRCFRSKVDSLRQECMVAETTQFELGLPLAA